MRRLGRVVQQHLGCSYSHAKREIEVGHVFVNGGVEMKPGALVRPSDHIDHRPDAPRRRRPPAAPPIELAHLDDDVVVVIKPAGLLVHPTVDGEQDTVLSRTGAEIERRTGRHHRVLVVHRLDRDASGVLVLALSHRAAEHLHRQFRAHTVDRRYLVLARGVLQEERVVVRGIGRPRPEARRAALADGRGRPARTTFRPVEALGQASLVEAELATGRTHQVRVHLAYLGHPVLGDEIYGDPGSDPLAAGRLALHAAVLGFVHPITGERLEFSAPLPAELTAAVAELRRRLRLRAPRRSAVTVPSRVAPRPSAAATRPRRPHRRPPHGAGVAPMRPGTRDHPKRARSRHRG